MSMLVGRYLRVPATVPSWVIECPALGKRALDRVGSLCIVTLAHYEFPHAIFILRKAYFMIAYTLFRFSLLVKNTALNWGDRKRKEHGIWS